MSIHEDRPTCPPTEQDEEEIMGQLTLDELVAKILSEHKLEDEQEPSL